jgi:flagellar hook-associated protein 3 FlgL
MTRVSTAGMHNSALAGILERNAALVKTQAQIASGKRILTPADDPSGAVRALDIDRSLAEFDQYARNSDVVTNRLTFEEQTLADMTNLLDRVRGLTLQGKNATVDSTGRDAIATEIGDRLDELMDMANRKDANGEYLFSGYSTLTQPFARTTTGVSYSGDQGVRSVQTSPTQKTMDGHSGFEVFQKVPEGNGTFVTNVSAANAGSVQFDGGSVVNPANWVKDDYTLRFTSATTYDIVDSLNNNVVTNATYTSGTAIAFRGVQVTLSGTPATNDAVFISSSGSEDMFTTLQKLVTALGRTNATGTDTALFNSELNNALVQIDRALDHTTSIRAEVGARLSVLEQTEENREDRTLDLKSALSDLRDLDYAEAITRLNIQMVGLQAAQSSYTQMSQLSLFDYLR